MRERQAQNKSCTPDELADLLRWCAALSTDPADLAGAVILAAGPRWPRLVDSPQDLRELTVHTFLRAAEPSDDGRLDKALIAYLMDFAPSSLAYDKLPKLQRRWR